MHSAPKTFQGVTAFALDPAYRASTNDISLMDTFLWEFNIEEQAYRASAKEYTMLDLMRIKLQYRLWLDRFTVLA